MISITLPYPPSANRYWRNYSGRTVVSAEAKAYKEQVALIANLSDLGSPLEGDVEITIHVYRPAKRRDLDNNLKVTIDSLQGILYENDSQICILHAYRHEDKNNPRVEVFVKEVFYERNT